MTYQNFIFIRQEERVDKIAGNTRILNIVGCKLTTFRIINLET